MHAYVVRICDHGHRWVQSEGYEDPLLTDGIPRDTERVLNATKPSFQRREVADSLFRTFADLPRSQKEIARFAGRRWQAGRCVTTR